MDGSSWPLTPSRIPPRSARARPTPYRAVMTTPAVEDRIMVLMPEDAKAVLLLAR
jgi:hypothetical protein